MKLKEAQQKFQTVLAEAKALNEKENRTDEETKSLSEKIAEGKELKGIIQQLEEQEADLKELGEFDNTPANNYKKAEIDGKDGEAILRNNKIEELTGFGLTEKAARAIVEPSYKKAFLKFSLGKEDKADLKALSEGSDPDGGYLVPPDIRNEVIARSAHPTRYLDFIDTIPTVRDVVKYPKLNYTTDDIYSNPMRIAWGGETGDSDEADNPQWGEVKIEVFTGRFFIEFSRDLRDDCPQTLESILSDLAVDSYRLGMEQIHLQGTGNDRPLGIMANAGEDGGIDTVNIGSTLGAGTPAELIKAVMTLPEQYSDNCQGFLTRSTFGEFDGLSDADNNLINLFGVSDKQTGLTQARIPQLLGYDLYKSAFVASVGIGNLIMLFGNVRRAYKRVQRLILSAEPYGLQDKSMLKANQMGLHFRFREGGRTVQPRAALAFQQSD
ncbi:MAG: phage major capsid protein [Armatimonadetes bacterium]|nr:phage major capsid protein [Armatimonadota bacterium]